MAFPTIPTVAAGRVVTGVQADASATRTFPSLTGLTKNSGDLLVAILIGYQDSLTATIFSSWGASFTELVDVGVASQHCVGIAYKWSDGTETGTFTVTQGGTVTGHAAMILLSIPGAHASTPPAAGTLITATAAAADPSALDPAAWAAEDTLWIALAGSGETATTGSFTGVASAPTNYSDYADTGISADVVGGVEAAAAFRQLNASSENVGTFSVDVSNARNCAIVLAVRPAPSTITLTPSPATIPIATPAPSLALSLALAPAATTLPLAVPAPTMALVYALAPDPVTLPLAVPAPTVALSLALAPSPVAVPLVVPDVTVDAGGPTELAPDPVTLPLSVPAPSIELGALTIAPDPVASSIDVPAPSIALSLGLSPDAVAVPLIVPAPSIAFALELAPAAGSIPLAVPAVSVAHSLTLTPASVAVPLILPAPSIFVAGGALTIAPDPVIVPLALPAVSLDFGPITISPDPVTIPMLLAAPSIAHVLGLVIAPVAVVLVVPAPVLGGAGTNLAPAPVVLVLVVPAITFRPPGKARIVVGDARLVELGVGDARATATMTGDARKVLVEVGDG